MIKNTRTPETKDKKGNVPVKKRKTMNIQREIFPVQKMRREN